MRLAIITGGSKGLGLALCQQFEERGYRVLEFSRTAPHAYSVRADLSAPEAYAQVVAKAIAPLDADHLEELVVINNAGTLAPIGPASRQSRSAVLANLNTNFTSAILGLTELIGKFQHAPCRKVLANISSGAAHKGYAGWSLYCASKAGMEGFVRALAIEQQLERHPFIPVNVNPGVIDTEMQALIRDAAVADFPEVERFIRRKHEGALVAPERVAMAVLQILASPSLASGGGYETSATAG
ncbi:SDR family NAD(P)-dependent oxidoreductase [Rhodoferax sp.]|uniref:SDR family NAD(P)-dependent oxidoreductase n=1 Tax=Rhodoferax sp. TaxID=50421 RepID=UPI00274D385A|nr:SDR family NAD(P)-dependent oxidoreductase [Rhodoferax sp.]